jgi:hypothetical protein
MRYFLPARAPPQPTYLLILIVSRAPQIRTLLLLHACGAAGTRDRVHSAGVHQCLLGGLVIT